MLWPARESIQNGFSQPMVTPGIPNSLFGPVGSIFLSCSLCSGKKGFDESELFYQFGLIH
jgi:hypothetical protein